jgi:hypothetical protein
MMLASQLNHTSPLPSPDKKMTVTYDLQYMTKTVFSGIGTDGGPGGSTAPSKPTIAMRKSSDCTH